MKRLKIPKEVIRICKTKKNRQYNAQQKKVKRTKIFTTTLHRKLIVECLRLDFFFFNAPM